MDKERSIFICRSQSPVSKKEQEQLQLHMNIVNQEKEHDKRNETKQTNETKQNKTKTIYIVCHT